MYLHTTHLLLPPLDVRGYIIDDLSSYNILLEFLLLQQVCIILLPAPKLVYYLHYTMSSSILRTPVRKESTTLILPSPPPPPRPATKLVRFPSLPNLAALRDEDYADDDERPIGFFLVAPPAIVNTTAATPPRRTDTQKRTMPVSPPSSPKMTLHPRPLKKLKKFP